MKKLSSALLHGIALSAIIFMLWSCTKQRVNPSATHQSATLSDALQSVENVTPGTYTILRFIDTGDDETSQFNGYTFRFRADGVLIARTNTGATFRGTWRLNQAETRMEINITGTKALDDLDDDDWRVVNITNQRISLRKPGPDSVVFVMQ